MLYTVSLKIEYEQIHKFTVLASGLNTDVDIKMGSICIDAKSVIGICSLDLSKSFDVSANVSCEVWNKFLLDLKEIGVKIAGE